MNIDLTLILGKCKEYKGKSWSALIKELEKQQPEALSMISIDENALKACRENNQDKTLDETIDPIVGGNGQKF
jgi:hypothetical protein